MAQRNPFKNHMSSEVTLKIEMLHRSNFLETKMQHSWELGDILETGGEGGEVGKAREIRGDMNNLEKVVKDIVVAARDFEE